MNLSFKKADWSLFTYFIAQLCLQLKIFSPPSLPEMMNPGLWESVAIYEEEEEEEQTVELAACLIGDLTVTSSDVFLLLLCRANISILSGVCSISPEQAFLCGRKFWKLDWKETIHWTVVVS